VSWQAFWNEQTTIYVSDRHKDEHYRLIANDIVNCLADTKSGANSRVLDFGCGENLNAIIVADTCKQLTLCDSADVTRNQLRAIAASRKNIQIAAPAELHDMPDGSLDVIVANSVVQYLTLAELESWLVVWRRLLDHDGTLILGDIVPPSVNPLTDALSLLRFANEKHFLTAAGLGLVKTFFSPYRAKRAALGLLQLSESEMIKVLTDHGFVAHRRDANIGHNPSRMTICATVRPPNPIENLPADLPTKVQPVLDRSVLKVAS
jgi:SAM-dependent methyltransferase